MQNDPLYTTSGAKGKICEEEEEEEEEEGAVVDTLLFSSSSFYFFLSFSFKNACRAPHLEMSPERFTVVTIELVSTSATTKITPEKKKERKRETITRRSREGRRWQRLGHAMRMTTHFLSLPRPL